MWSNQKRMVRRIAKGRARKMSETGRVWKGMNHERGSVGSKAPVVGRVESGVDARRPMYGKPVKKMMVRGVP